MADDGSSHGGKKEASFRAHLAVYLVFAAFFFVLNMLTGPGELWFYWPMLGWGLGLALHAIAVYGADAPAEVASMLHSWTARLHAPPAPPVPPRPVRHRDATARARPEAQAQVQVQEQQPVGLRQLILDGETKVDGMRAQARRIGKPDVRDRALAICASADRILGVLGEVPAEGQLARDFVDRYLTPAEAIVSRYARLSSRGISTAEPTLVKVETEDLPLLDAKMRELYDRLHRGDLIDLEVAREMLALDFGDAGTDAVPPDRKPNSRQSSPS
jgi:hypothetical protein